MPTFLNSLDDDGMNDINKVHINKKLDDSNPLVFVENAYYSLMAGVTFVIMALVAILIISMLKVRN